MISPSGQARRRSFHHVRADAVKRLEARRSEIEEAILGRVHAVSNPADEGTEYLEGLRAAVTAAVGYCLRGVELGEERSGPIPAQVIAQARLAARNRVGLEVVLRRYFAGYTALDDFLMREARDDGERLYRLQRDIAAIFDRLVVTVSAEYHQEAEHSLRSPEQRTAERVKRLLAGELVDTAELDYDLEAHHLGVIASGPEARPLLRDLATALDRRLLLAESAEHTVWAWLGGRHRLDPATLAAMPTIARTPWVLLAIGEPACGLAGWRLTHRQAEAALVVALRRSQPLTRYADVALLASILRDDDLVGFLTDTYLAPLAAERDGGEALRQTLRAFFAAGRNASSAAAALGIARQTVTSRLRTIESRVGRPLDACGAEIEAALRLVDFEPIAVSTIDQGHL